MGSIISKDARVLGVAAPQNKAAVLAFVCSFPSLYTQFLRLLVSRSASQGGTAVSLGNMLKVVYTISSDAHDCLC